MLCHWCRASSPPHRTPRCGRCSLVKIWKIWLGFHYTRLAICWSTISLFRCHPFCLWLRLRVWLRHRRRLQLGLCALLTARGGDKHFRCCTRFRPSVSCCCESLTRFFFSLSLRLSLLSFVMYLLCLVCFAFVWSERQRELVALCRLKWFLKMNV